MASRKFLVNIDLNTNELLNAKLQNLATDPSSTEDGIIYFNTSSQEVRVYANSQWVNLGETYVHPTFPGNGLGGPLGGATVISDVQVNSEGHVTGFTTRELDTGDLTNNEGFVIIDDGVTNTTDAWSSQKIQDELDAINGTVAGTLVYQGGYDASTNTPDLDGSPSGVSQGDTYAVTADGDFFSEGVQVGDLLIAETNDPTVRGDWTIVNKNIPDIVSASDTEEGIIEIATQAEVDAGTDTTRAVTPDTLEGALGGYRFNTLIGDGSTTDFTVTHNLGSINVSITLVDTNDSAVVEAEEIITDNNNVDINFNTAPTTDQYRVAIIS